jgi:DNA-binding MarR family transcriptional regulator
MQDKRSNQQILFLTDEQLRLGIEAMFFAYKGITIDPDNILKNYSYGRAHHRAIHFINSYPGTTVNNLLQILGVTKQSLNRVLRSLIMDGLVEVNIGKIDKRQRNLILTTKGKDLENKLSISQRDRMRLAYKAAGPDAVAGFRTVLEYIVVPNGTEDKNKSGLDSELLE